MEDLLSRSSEATTFERNISLNNVYTNEIETEKELENDPPNILDLKIPIQSMRNKALGQIVINLLHSLIKKMQIEHKNAYGVKKIYKSQYIKTRGTNYSVTIIKEYHYYTQDT